MNSPDIQPDDDFKLPEDFAKADLPRFFSTFTPEELLLFKDILFATSFEELAPIQSAAPRRVHDSISMKIKAYQIVHSINYTYFRKLALDYFSN